LLRQPLDYFVRFAINYRPFYLMDAGAACAVSGFEQEGSPIWIR
jgi:hypothetical protein